MRISVIGTVFFLTFFCSLPIFVFSGEFEVPRITEAPVIDGSSKDTVWQGIPWISDFRDGKLPSRKAAVQTKFKAAHDNSFLYFIVRAEEPSIGNLITSSRNIKDANIWSDDSVEIFIDPGRLERRYYHLIINHHGTIYDSHCEFMGAEGLEFAMDSGWDISAKAAVAKGKDYWTVEFVLPLAEMDITPEAEKFWGINIARNRRAGGRHELSSFAPMSFAPMRDGFHQPEKFAAAEFEDLDASPYSWVIGSPSEESLIMEKGQLVYSFTLPVRNKTGRFQRLLIESSLVGPSGGKSTVRRGASLSPEREQRLSVSVPVAEQGENRLVLTLARLVAPDVPMSVRRFPLNLTYTPISIKFITPPYRDSIYATQDIPEVEVETRLELPEEDIKGKSLFLELEDAEGKVSYSKTELKDPPAVARFNLDVAGLYEGKYIVTAVLKSGGGKEHRVEKSLRKLPYQKNEVWIDENGVTHVDGKPFLPFGWFDGPREKSDGYNVAQRYHSFFSEAYLKSWLDNAYENDTMVMIYPYQEFLSGGRREVFASEKRKQELTREQEVKIRHLVEKFGDHPALLAWYMADEPEGRDHSPEWYKSVYELLREIDPYRPCVMLNYSIWGMRKYYESCDILMPDCYPVFKKDMPAKKPLSEQGRYVDEGRKLRPMWFVPQAFDWSIWSSKAHYLPSSPNPRLGERRKYDRPPTYKELRSQAYQVISHGATGLVWYSHSSTHYYFNLHQKLGMPYLSGEISALEKAILSPCIEGGGAVNPEEFITAFSVREAGGEKYLFAVNTSSEPVDAEFRLKDFGGRSLYVVSEDRSVRVSGGGFADKFEGFETHIYTTDLSLKGLTTVEEIEAGIAKAEAGRSKPGNILFDNPKIEVSVSSYDYWKYSVADGLTEDCGLLYWRAEPGGRIEISFQEEESISRIAVYGAGLKDFSIRVDGGGGWTTVKEVRGNKSDWVEAAFGKRGVRRIRLDIAGIDGNFAKLKEIEAYR